MARPRKRKAETDRAYASRLIGFFVREGFPHKQAIAIGLQSAGISRVKTRTKPSGPVPAHSAPPVTIKKASDGKHKFVAVVRVGATKKTIPFGAKGMSDYTIHHDKERRQRYITRHKAREDWTKSGRLTAGFYSKHLLWGPTPSLKNNLEIVLRRYWSSEGRRPRKSPVARRSL